jgi:hypothetical protein
MTVLKENEGGGSAGGDGSGGSGGGVADGTSDVSGTKLAGGEGATSYSQRKLVFKIGPTSGQRQSKKGEEYIENMRRAKVIEI